MGVVAAVEKATQIRDEMRALLAACLEEKKEQEEEARSSGRGMPDEFYSLIGLMWLNGTNIFTEGFRITKRYRDEYGERGGYGEQGTFGDF